MWTKPNFPRLLTVLTLLGTCCSSVNADTFKVVTQPSPGQEPSAQPTSSFKVVSPPPSDQATARLTQTDEPLPQEGFNFNPRPQPRVNSQGCSNNEASVPCLIQQVLLPAGAGRQIDFGRDFAKIMISEPDTIEVIPISNQKLFIRPLHQEQSVTENTGNTSKTYSLSNSRKYGYSDISVYDKDDNRIGVIEVTIEPFVIRKGNVPTVVPDPFAISASVVAVYRGIHPFYYRCASEVYGGCIAD